MKIVYENRFSGKTYFYTIAPSRLDLLLTYKKSSHGSRQLQWIKKWGDFFAKNQARSGGAHAQDSPFLAHLNALNLEISKTARKEQNYNLSYRYLFKVPVQVYDLHMTFHDIL